MRKYPFISIAAATLFFFCAASPVSADVSLPSVIGENMVLQQGMPIPIWGWADPGEEVTVKLERRKESATADGDGCWKVEIKKMKAGGPYTMTVSGNNTINLYNILVGEVWVCSGQSNMQWSVQASQNSKMEIAAANYPRIRLFTAERTVASEPQKDVPGKWVECSPETVGEFSAVGYFFGRELHNKLQIPIGLINSSWGGTRAEAWTSMPTLKSDPMYQAILERGERDVENFKEAFDQYEEAYENWKQEMREAEVTGEPVPNPPRMPNLVYRNPHRPAVLYNGMIAPLIPYAVQGAIWYQGESNAGRAYQYRSLFKDMILDWRKNWGNEDLAFLFVQLANFIQTYSPDTAWAELREAQAMALKLPNTGMAVTIDIGNPTDIHPRNKQEVGRRLALDALAGTYGKDDVIYSGPMYKSMEKEGAKIRISFNHLGGGLISGDGKDLQGFLIAGSDRQFEEANAMIDGNDVIVWSDKVTRPAAVRYAWKDNPEECNLYNRAGLPANPFRTDDWPGVTVNER